MAKAKLDIKTVPTQAIEAAVGATDLAVGVVRSSVADLQKRLAGVQKNVSSFEPQAFVSTSVENLTKDAKARRAAIEKLVAALQAEALAVPNRVQETATDTYADLVKRGETLVGRIRRQPSTKATVKSADTTVTKAKTTKTQGTKAAKKTSTAAKKSTTATKKRTAATRSSAKATTTSARKTASSAASAVVDAAEKVGD